MIDQTQPRARPRKFLVLLPLIITLALGALFYSGLRSGRDLSVIPSALIGSPAPKTELPPLDGLGIPGLDSSQFAGKVTLVNVFASWCGPCHEEHPVLMDLARDKRFNLWAINYKDRPQDASRFLTALGNPFSALGVDERGRTTIDWGVYGVPETFLVGRNGAILYKHVGPITPQALKERLMPEIEKALAATDASS